MQKVEDILNYINNKKTFKNTKDYTQELDFDQPARMTAISNNGPI